jgi:NADH dehydrogenase
MFSPGVVQAGLKIPDAASAASQAAGGGAAAGAAATAGAAGAAAASGAAAAANATSAASAAAGAAATAATSVTSAADATSAASAAAGAASSGAAATGSAAAVAGTAAPGAAGAVHGPWMDTTRTILDPHWGIVSWFRGWFMDGIFSHIPYTWFQVIIVMTEMLVGLALFGGVFTWWAAVVSLGLCIIFTLSGMFAWNQLWFFFAAILMLGGAGRAFGLDSWIVPFFKQWWNGTRLARRTRFYADEPTK